MTVHSIPEASKHTLREVDRGDARTLLIRYENVSKGTVAMVMLDVFNVLNSNAVSNFTLVNGANYNKILGGLQPRTVQIGTRVEF